MEPQKLQILAYQMQAISAILLHNTEGISDNAKAKALYAFTQQYLSESFMAELKKESEK